MDLSMFAGCVHANKLLSRALCLHYVACVALLPSMLSTLLDMSCSAEDTYCRGGFPNDSRLT
jgi:hypothetical protein